jgi:hypothetical protein
MKINKIFSNSSEIQLSLSHFKLCEHKANLQQDFYRTFTNKEAHLNLKSTQTLSLKMVIIKRD